MNSEFLAVMMNGKVELARVLNWVILEDSAY